MRRALLPAIALVAANALPGQAHDWHWGKYSSCEYQVMNHGYGRYGENGVAFAATRAARAEVPGDGCTRHRTRVGNDCGWQYQWGAWGYGTQVSWSQPGNVEDVPNGCQWWSEHYLVLAGSDPDPHCLRFNFGGYGIRNDGTCYGVNADDLPEPNPNCPNPIATICRNLEVIVP